MADVSKKTTKVKKVIDVDQTDYVLTLNVDEAHTLYSILMRIGGDPVKSRRRYAESIRKVLREAGFSQDPLDISEHARAIYFKDVEDATHV